MNRYSLENKCIKCGHYKTDNQFMKGIDYDKCKEQKIDTTLTTQSDVKHDVVPSIEYISRECENCHYVWDEAPLDARRLSNE